MVVCCWNPYLSSPDIPSSTNILKLSGLSELFTSLQLWFSPALKYCRCLLNRDEITTLIWMLRFFRIWWAIYVSMPASIHPDISSNVHPSVHQSIYVHVKEVQHLPQQEDMRRGRALLPLGTIWSSCLVGRHRCCMQGTFPGMSFCHWHTMPGTAM